MTNFNIETLDTAKLGAGRRTCLGPGAVFAFDETTLYPCHTRELEVKARIAGPSAAIEYLLKLEYLEDTPREAYFCFPFDDGLAPAQLRFKVDDRIVECQLSERQAAEEHYKKSEVPNAVVQAFKGVGEKILLVSMGVLNPGSRVVVSFAYSSFLSLVDGCFTIRFPMQIEQALTSPYNALSSGPLHELGVEEKALPLGLDSAKISLQFFVEAAGLRPGRFAATHPVDIAPTKEQHFLARYLTEGYQELADFQLRYSLWDQPSPHGVISSVKNHFLLTLYPPGQAHRSQAKDLVILIDGSEQMAGQNFQRVKHLVNELLQKLDPEDRFAIVLFNRELSGYKQGSFCPQHEKQEAITWLVGEKPRGQADFKVLLGRILQLPKEPGRFVSCLLIAAGNLGNEPELYDLMVSENADIRFQSLGVSTRVSKQFLRQTARFTRGQCILAGDGEDLVPYAQEIIEGASLPVLSEIGFREQGLGVKFETLTPQRPSGLTSMRPLFLYGVYTNPEGGMTLHGKALNGSDWGEKIGLNPSVNPALHLSWAQSKYLEMSDEISLRPGPYLAEQKAYLQNICVEFKVLSEYTTLIARDSETLIPVVQPSIFPSKWYSLTDTKMQRGRLQEALSEQKHVVRAGLVAQPGAPQQEETMSSATPTTPIRKGLVVKARRGGGLKSKLGGKKLMYQSKLQGGIKEDMLGKPVLQRVTEQESKSGEAPVSPHPSIPLPGIEQTPEILSSSEPEGSQENEHSQGAGATLSEAILQPPVPASIELDLPPTTSSVEVQPKPQEAPNNSVEATQQEASVAQEESKPPQASQETPPDFRRWIQGEPELKQSLMNAMRTFYGKVRVAQGGVVDPEIKQGFEDILKLIHKNRASHPMLKRVFDVGYKYHGDYVAGQPQAVEQIQTWLKKFGSLF